MRLTTSLAAASLALSLMAGSAFAQQRPPAQPAPTAPATQQIQLKEVSPSHLAIARQVAVASGITRSFAGVVEQITGQLRQMAASRSDIKTDIDQILTEMKPELDLQQQQIVNAAALVFANFMTETELKDIDVFFKSPTGQKYVQTQPQVMDAFVQQFQTWSNQLAEYVMVRTRTELTKRGKSLNPPAAPAPRQ